MKEQEPKISQNELTSQPNSSNLKSEGDIFMAEGNNGDGPEQSPRDRDKNNITMSPPEARERLFALRQEPGDDPDSYNMVKSKLAQLSGLLGEARLKKKDGDENEDEIPIVVVDYKGRGEDGKQYVVVELPGEGEEIKHEIVPLGDIHYPERKKELTQQEEELLELEFENSDKRLKIADSNFRQWMSEMGMEPEFVDGLAKEVFKKSSEATRAGLRSRAEHGHLEPITVPQSLEDLARLVMKRSNPEWRKDGSKPILKDLRDKEGNFIGEVVDTAHFLDWSRHNILKVHGANPLDPINFFSDIGTNVRTDLYGGAISFYEITFGDSFFLRERNDGTTETSKEYEALHTQMLFETFLLMGVRNPDVQYRPVRGSAKEMLDVLRAALIKNPITRSNFMEFILSLPSTHRKSIYDIDSSRPGEELSKKQEGNFYVGNAVREALATYMSIYDYEQLKEILGEDSPLFKIEFDKDGKPKEHEDKIKNGEKDTNKWFDKDGKLILYAVDEYGKYITKKIGGENTYLENDTREFKFLPHPDFMRNINIFLGAVPSQIQQEKIREKIAKAIMHKEGISMEEAKLAELFAYSMTHITGVAARNDIDSVSFDWWTRVTNFKDKRKREKAEKRNSTYGLKHNMEGLKRICLNFFEGVQDENKRSIQGIILGTKKDKNGEVIKHIDITGSPVKNNVDYERDSTGRIMFYDSETGKVTQGLNAVKHEWSEDKTIVVFKDAGGNVVDTRSHMPKVVITEVAEKITFGDSLQAQYLNNHVENAAKVYSFIYDKVVMNIPEIVTGYDAYGNPILDSKKLNELKDTISHDLRYVVATWGGIDFGEKVLDWEGVEDRDKTTGRLIAKRQGPNNKTLYLDEDWYILDENGKRTDDRNEPVTYTRVREMTRLEQMFGVEALAFIQHEIEERGLSGEGDEKRPMEKVLGRDWRGIEHEVEVDITNSKKDEFRTAVFYGAFNFLIAAEICAHRDRGSGLGWYTSDEMKRLSDALTVGNVIVPRQVKNIRKETRTTAGKVYSQDFAFAFSVGGLEGFWKVFEIMYKDILSGK